MRISLQVLIVIIEVYGRLPYVKKSIGVWLKCISDVVFTSWYPLLPRQSPTKPTSRYLWRLHSQKTVELARADMVVFSSTPRRFTQGGGESIVSQAMRCWWSICPFEIYAPLPIQRY